MFLEPLPSAPSGFQNKLTIKTHNFSVGVTAEVKELGPFTEGLIQRGLGLNKHEMNTNNNTEFAYTIRSFSPSSFIVFSGASI